MLNFACHILGEDYSILKGETPESKKKVLLLCSILFIPVILWFFQGLFLSKNILGLSLWSSFATGVVLAFLIFLLERAIIMAPKNGMMTFFRIFLGLMVASIGSVIIDEIIFHKDIDNQMITYQNNLLQIELNAVDDKYKLELSNLKEMATSKYTIWNTAMEEVKAEADGTGGSGVKGVSEITKTKLTLTEAQGKSYQDASNALGQLESKRDQEIGDRRAEFEAGFSGQSLLTRMKVMFHFIASDAMMLIIYCIITLALFSLEFLVVIIKSCTPQTHYEFKLQKMEEMARARTEKIVNRDLNMYNPAMQSSHAQEAKLLISRGDHGYFKVG